MYELGKVVHNKYVIGITYKTRLSTSKILKCQTKKKRGKEINQPEKKNTYHPQRI